jgi:ATP-dependent Lhr-like helicase
LFLRRNAGLWSAKHATPDVSALSGRAKAVFESLQAQGASFLEDILEGAGLLRSEVEAALGELVTQGLVSSDSFAGLRSLIGSSAKRKDRNRARASMDGGGRWSLAGQARSAQSATDRDKAVEHIARVLLRRYGIVFWRMLAREASWLPPWRDLLRVYRSLEARGEIRGGRFVAGFAGEQFALPDAIGLLREQRREKTTQEFLSVSGADPLNLAGILTPGPKLAALTGNRVLFRDGVPVALFAGGNVQFLEELDANDAWDARKALLRSPARAGLGNSAQSFARSLARRKRAGTATAAATGAAVTHNAAAKEE